MASKSNATADLKRTVNAVYELKNTHASAVLTDTDAIYDSYAGDEVAKALNTKTKSLTALTDMNTTLTAQAKLDLVELAQAVGYVGTDVTAGAAHLRRYMTDSGEFTGDSVSEKFTARGITRGTLNMPTGVHLARSTYDEVGEVSQIGSGEAITASVTSTALDATQVVTLQSEGPAPADPFTDGASGATLTLTLENESSNSLLTNPNLLSSGTTTDATNVGVSDIDGWTIDAADVFDIDEDKTWRSLTYTLQASKNGYIEQALPTNLQSNVPYMPYVVANADGSFNGDMKITIGGTAYSSVWDGTDSAWTVITPTLTNGYMGQTDTANGKIKVEITGMSAGTINIARIGFVPMTGGINKASFGTWWLGVVKDGNPTYGANSTITDTLSVSGKITDVFANLDINLPTSGSNTVADPS
jgi:hypothetical protein